MTSGATAAIIAANAANMASNNSGGEITQEQAIIILSIISASVLIAAIFTVVNRNDPYTSHILDFMIAFFISIAFLLFAWLVVALAFIAIGG